MGGHACIRGMRIPVSVIVSQIADGATFEEVLREYPDLEREDIEQALAYAAETVRDTRRPAESVKILVSDDGQRRVVITQRADGTFALTIERWQRRGDGDGPWDFEGWLPLSTSASFCASLEIAEREAKERFLA